MATDFLLLATGFTGALTLVWLVRLVVRALVTPPSLLVQIRPAGGWTDAVLQELRQARREVLVLTRVLAHPVLAQALVDVRQRRRASVEILLSHQAERDPRSDLPFLLEQGLRPTVDPENEPGPGVVVILDRRTVLTGTWQPTTGAEVGDETLLVIRSHREAIDPFVQSFLAHKANARAAAVWSDSAPRSVGPTRLPDPPAPEVSLPAPLPAPEPVARMVPMVSSVVLPPAPSAPEPPRAVNVPGVSFTPMTMMPMTPMTPMQAVESFPLPPESPVSYPLPPEAEEPPLQPAAESFALPEDADGSESSDDFLSLRTAQLLASLRQSGNLNTEPPGKIA